jgi:asparagine synthase (glutamine-hydrolysing)
VILASLVRDTCRIKKVGQQCDPAGSGSRIDLLLAAPNIRIDNNGAIAQACGISPAAKLEDLLAAGWQKWGTGLAAQLRGAFAFVLRDRTNGACYAARDQFGLSPLFVRETSDSFHFGRTSQALRAAENDGFSDDRLMLADFVAGAYIERKRTFFIGIERFPEAHWALYHGNEKRQQRYWSLSDVQANPDPDAPVERFRALLDRSVAACLRPGETALMLSGGLDSSAIAASAAALGDVPLDALSLTYHQSQDWCDDKHLAAVADMIGLAPLEVAGDAHDPLQDMEFWLRAVDGPYLPQGHSVSFQLLKKATEIGDSIVLCGHGGDEIVSYGFGRLNELAIAGRWWQLWRETHAASQLYGNGRIALFRRYLSHKPYLRPLIRWLGRNVGRKAPVQRRFLSEHATHDIPAGRYDSRPAAGRLDHDERMLHREALEQALQPGSLEVFALCSYAVGVETRMPFYDVELTELSFSLPSALKMRDGFSRYVLRAAYRGDLPEATLKRRDKFNFAPAFIAGLVSQRDKVLDLTQADFADPWHIVNRRSLDEARESLYRNGAAMDTPDAFFLWRVAVLGLWSRILREPVADFPAISDD